jgi:hypothetical protein
VEQQLTWSSGTRWATQTADAPVSSPLTWNTQASVLSITVSASPASPAQTAQMYTIKMHNF